MCISFVAAQALVVACRSLIWPGMAIALLLGKTSGDKAINCHCFVRFTGLVEGVIFLFVV